MSECTAWVLSLPGRLHAAVGPFELVHILPTTPTLFEVPGTPAYCRHALVWQDQILPLMDLGARVRGTPGLADDTVTLIGLRWLAGIVAYRDPDSGEVRHGGLQLARVPERSVVTDAQACRLPRGLRGWRPLAISCFEHPHLGAVPILDLARVFSAPPQGAYEEKGAT